MALRGYENFASVIAIQLLWFALMTLLRGSLSAAPRRLALGALAGLPIGVVFDVAIGKAASIFHYAGLELQGGFLILNSVLSYGLAVATVLSVQVANTPPFSGQKWPLVLGCGCAAITSAVLLSLSGRSPAVSMLLAGALVLVLSEAAAVALGRRGYILQLMFGQWFPALQILAFSISTGVVYETANYFFPLWIWTNRNPTPAGNLLLIVVFGYFVLFLPIFTTIGVARVYLRRSSLKDSVI